MPEKKSRKIGTEPVFPTHFDKITERGEYLLEKYGGTYIRTHKDMQVSNVFKHSMILDMSKSFGYPIPEGFETYEIETLELMEYIIQTNPELVRYYIQDITRKLVANKLFVYEPVKYEKPLWEFCPDLYEQAKERFQFPE